ncbi:MAG: hypothetical protein KJO66_06210, partial [Gammaproteobacteria bacterium]|nr:hypothetical protein [Gammaproteobacteria bacterium]
MDAISSQLLYRYSPDRSAERPEQSSRKHHPLDGHHPGRRVGHAHRHEQAQGVEHRREIDDSNEERRHPAEHAGENGKLSYRHSERTALHIRTQEGDMVRLKIRASESLSIAAGQDENDDGKTISELDLQARSLTRISLKVKGELNGEEMAAIQSVIEQAGTMAENFFTGDAEGAFATASALEIDAAQLANVRIRMKSSEQLTYPGSGALPARLTAPQAPTTEPAGTSPAPVSGASADNPATSPAGTAVEDTGADSANVEAAAVVPVPAEADTVDSADATGRTSIMANTLQSIGVFLNNLMDTFSGTDDGQGGVVSADNMTLKLQVFRSMLLSVSELQDTKQEDPATTLAAETLDAVSTQQTPLD